MKQKKNANQKKAERTPIIDGDTRPDQSEVNIPSSGRPGVKKREVTPNRGADVNSLEDFKDGKS